MIIGVPASVFRAGQTKGEDFVVSGSTDFPVTRSPIEGAVYDKGSRPQLSLRRPFRSGVQSTIERRLGRHGYPSHSWRDVGDRHIPADISYGTGTGTNLLVPVTTAVQ